MLLKVNSIGIATYNFIFLSDCLLNLPSFPFKQEAEEGGTNPLIYQLLHLGLKNVYYKTNDINSCLLAVRA